MPPWPRTGPGDPSRREAVQVEAGTAANAREGARKAQRSRVVRARNAVPGRRSQGRADRQEARREADPQGLSWLRISGQVEVR